MISVISYQLLMAPVGFMVINWATQPKFSTSAFCRRRWRSATECQRQPIPCRHGSTERRALTQWAVWPVMSIFQLTKLLYSEGFLSAKGAFDPTYKEYCSIVLFYWLERVDSCQLRIYNWSTFLPMTIQRII